MGYQFELRHLIYFIAVAEELHFRKAAERLHISQPGLSRQIKQLEEVLDMELFKRDKREVSLTIAGKYLYEEVITTLNDLDRAVNHAQLLAKGISGQLNLGFLGSAMQIVIPNLLKELMGKYPNMQTSLKELSNPEQVEGLLHDRLDLGFVRLEQVPDPLHIKPVLKDSFSLVLPQRHWLNEENFKDVGQVESESFILFAAAYSSTYYHKIISICEDQGFRPKVSHQSVHAPTIYKLVEMGLGVAIVPTSLQLGYDMGVKFLELKNIRQEAILSAVWKDGNRNPALNRALQLIEFLE